MGLLLSEEQLKYCKERIIDFIRNEVNNARASYGIVAVSGGIDSALTLYLSKQALGDRVIALIMPERGVTRKEDVRDAIELAENLNVKYYKIEINEIVKAFKKVFPRIRGKNRLIAYGNLKARIRMCLNYLVANLKNGLVIGTGNKTELLLGYFTKYGDGGVDILPIGDLYKTQVRQLARYVGIPEKIINKTPTSGLWKGQTDEGELGMSYDIIDKILYKLYDEKKDIDSVSNELNIDKSVVIKFKEMVEKNVHKRQAPKILKLF